MFICIFRVCESSRVSCGYLNYYFYIIENHFATLDIRPKENTDTLGANKSSCAAIREISRELHSVKEGKREKE